MLLIDARPLGLGQVSIDSRTLKSARLKTNILVSNTIIHRSGLILTALTSLLQLVSMMHLSCAELISIVTVVPDHDFVSWISRGLSTSNNGKNIGFMDHFDNTDAGSELP